MGFFNKKYDYQKDNIQLKYNFNKNKYEFVLIKEKEEIILEEKQLSRNSKKYLDKRNQELKDNPMLIEEKKWYQRNEEKIKYFTSIGLSCDCFETLGGVKGGISDSLKNYLEDLLKDEENLIGLHRIGNANPIDILKSGIIINTHLMGAVNHAIKLSNTISYYTDNRIILKELMHSSNYKNSKGSILVKIPFKDIENKTNLYINDGNITRLNPKYIVGYIPVMDNYQIDSIITKEDLKQKNIITDSILEEYLYLENINSKEIESSTNNIKK